MSQSMAQSTGNCRRRGRISRREFLRLGGAGLGALGVSACGGGEGARGGGKLVFSFGPDAGGGLQKLVDGFNEQNRGEVQVEWREMPAVSDEYFEQLLTQFQAGSSDIDVIAGDVIWPAQFAANGYIADLSDRFPEDRRSDYLRAPVEANLYEGAIYGVPWFTDAGMFYYRKDLLEQSGFSAPPETYEDLAQMSEKISRDSGTEFGFVFQGAADEGGVVDALEYIWNSGGEVLEGDRVVIESPEAVRGLNTRRGLVESGVTPRAITTYGTQESQTAFVNGDAVFMRNWPFVYDLLSDSATSRVRPEQVGLAQLPFSSGRQGFSGLGGWNFFVNAGSREQDAAWEFIRYMSAPEQQRTFALESSRLPTLKSLYEDEEIRRKVPVAALGQEAIKNARPRPVSPYYSDMSLKMQQEFNAALKGDTSSASAVRTLQNELQRIVAQEG